MAELPSGTVTFLFTDLEVSTRLWDQEPDAMRAALARHDSILRDAMAVHGGQVVKGRGDGVHAVFATADGAIGAAIDAQVAIGAESWGVSEPLRVRIGIHSGTAELRDGDYFGSAVNRAARLEAVAHGGQIVCSQATADLVRDWLPASVELVDLGDHTLRDLARAERVFQVAHPGLERDFAPLTSLDAFGGNLPVQVTSFVGRDEDVARVTEVLNEVSLVTLIGTGGVGKTRLAVQVAAEVLPRFADGAWFCELAAVDDSDAMAQVVASTLSCSQRPGLSLQDSIVEYVKVRELLVVLDNCEHLLDAAGALADAVVRRCPKVTVLATSREALDVAGERVLRVRSLDAPDLSAPLDAVTASAAVRLFTDRAADAGAETAWDAVQWAAVGEICRRVDGIPLAIELAAARIPSMSPADVASHLDERFRLLTGKRRGQVERQQTLRATVEWSYQLLDNDERAVFDRLGVFAGAFAAPAAAAVAGGDDLDGWAVTDALSSLVAKSMLGAETGPDAIGRYAMNETLRQYAREQLDQSGDIDRWRHAHAEHYARWAHDIGYGLLGPDDTLWMTRLRAELDNVRAAVGWALDRNTPQERELGLRILASLVEARTARDMGLGALGVQAIPAAEASNAELRVPVLTIAAYHHWNQGRVEDARSLARAAMRDGIVTGILNPLAPHQAAVAFAMTAGDVAGALEIVDDTRAALDSIDNLYARTYFLGTMATFESMGGRIDDARADAERAVELARQLQNRSLNANAQHSLAWALQRDDPTAALAAAEKYLELSRLSEVLAFTTSAVMALAGGLRSRLGDDPGALELLHEAVVLARDQGARPQLAATLDWALRPLLATGQPEIAATFLGTLTTGALAQVANFPGVHASRTRTLERLRSTLGEATTHELIRQGTAMSYDEIVEYAVSHLDQYRTNRA
jgi:predicted ATPase/class 3 adenylate cyclase